MKYLNAYLKLWCYTYFYRPVNSLLYISICCVCFLHFINNKVDADLCCSPGCGLNSTVFTAADISLWIPNGSAVGMKATCDSHMMSQTQISNRTKQQPAGWQSHQQTFHLRECSVTFVQKGSKCILLFYHLAVATCAIEKAVKCKNKRHKPIYLFF